MHGSSKTPIFNAGGRGGGPKVEEKLAKTLVPSRLPETSSATENDQTSFVSDHGKICKKAHRSPYLLFRHFKYF